MVKRESTLDHILKHSNDSHIHTAVPESVTFEKGLKTERDYNSQGNEYTKQESEVETVDFQDLEEGVSHHIDYDEVTVVVEPGEYVSWKLVKDEKDLVVSRMIPWNRVIDISWGFPTIGGEE